MLLPDGPGLGVASRTKADMWQPGSRSFLAGPRQGNMDGGGGAGDGSQTDAGELQRGSEDCLLEGFTPVQKRSAEGCRL